MVRPKCDRQAACSLPRNAIGHFKDCASKERSVADLTQADFNMLWDAKQRGEQILVPGPPVRRPWWKFWAKG